MTKSELIGLLASKQSQLEYRDVELAVKELIEHMSAALADGERIEVRGFGSFSLQIHSFIKGNAAHRLLQARL